MKCKIMGTVQNEKDENRKRVSQQVLSLPLFFVSSI